MSEEEVRIKLMELRKLAIQYGDGTYGDLDRALKEIDAIFDSENLSNECRKIEYLVGPTTNLQDLSIDCGWGDRFLVLAEEIERLINGST